jgi:uncharacterized coiled-coil protein SlyX
MDAELKQRLVKMESHLVHIEHLVDQLNEVVTEQSRTLDRLKSQLMRQGQTIESFELERIKDTKSRPPHSAP